MHIIIHSVDTPMYQKLEHIETTNQPAISPANLASHVQGTFPIQFEDSVDSGGLDVAIAVVSWIIQWFPGSS